jgi:hypothetical protein
LYVGQGAEGFCGCSGFAYVAAAEDDVVAFAVEDEVLCGFEAEAAICACLRNGLVRVVRYLWD